MPNVKVIEPYADDNGNFIVGTPKSAHASEVTFNARNCRLEIAEGAILRNCHIQFDCDNGFCSIGTMAHYIGFIRVGLGCKVVIGKGLTITNNCMITTAENTSVLIGEDCMFSSNIDIRSDDAHPIYDTATGIRVNKSKDILIGDHVWLGAHVAVLGGSRIGDGSVIGYRSIVKATIPCNSIAAGAPAKVVRREITWRRDHLNLTPPYHFPCIGPGAFAQQPIMERLLKAMFSPRALVKKCWSLMRKRGG